MAGEHSTLGIDGLVDVVEIGAGRFATVYRARQSAYDRLVAVKVFHELTVDAATFATFQRECQAVGRVGAGKNILVGFDEGVTSRGSPYMIMPFMTGGSLLDELDRQGSLPWPEVVALGVKLAVALETAHAANVLHRDVKPANVLLDAGGEPQLADFGTARLTDATRISVGPASFTPAHVAPEVLRGAPATALADVYSLGSTLFELLAGRPAFDTSDEDSFFVVTSRVESSPVPDLRPAGVPDALCHVIESAMAKDPADRPASAGTMAAALAPARRPTPVRSDQGRISDWERIAPPVDDLLERNDGTVGRRRVSPLGIALIAVAVIAVSAAVAIGVLALKHKPTKTAASNTTNSSVPGVTSATTAATTSTTAPNLGLQEAQSLNGLLAQSSNNRSAIVQATTDIARCGALSQDEATLRSAAESRQALVTELAQLNLAQLPTSSSLLSSLNAAWQASLQADNDYAGWASDLQVSGCGPPASSDANWQAAQTADKQATAAKAQFVAAVGNQIAGGFGLPQYNQAQI